MVEVERVGRRTCQFGGTGGAADVALGGAIGDNSTIHPSTDILNGTKAFK